VTIFDAGEEHDLAYIAMEFLKGKDLLDFCKDGNLLPVPTVLSIVARVAEALAYAHMPECGAPRHQAGQHHVRARQRHRQGDRLRHRPHHRLQQDQDRTGAGHAQLHVARATGRQKVDGRSDLYSLGVMLFQMLTGVLPFRGDSMAELMYKIANEEAPTFASSARNSREPGQLVALSM
jgi:serine/threonine protein kinase